ncbi:HNH endonuclease [Corynebacterium anserum]|uniref:HNH endonuclease n=2 Tax=Corynebacterium anserum TaxID=2684406 RepID=UPI00163EF279|nr:HNH endonuclease [Corynebacterium anserum]
MSLITVILVVAVGTEASGAQQVAATEHTRTTSDIRDKQRAREFAVEMLGTNFMSSRAAAEAVLRGGEVELDAYANGGMQQARIQDLRQIVVTISAAAGSAVQAAADKALESGDEQALADFIDAGWSHAQQLDDRATAWRAARAPAGTSVKAAADRALQANTPEALSDFATTGYDIAKAHDRRREVYALTRSTSPAVARGAQEAIQTGTDTAIDSYLRYGQFVAAAQDAEKMSIDELVNSAVTEADKAQTAANVAAQNADQAARATDAARLATERAKSEAQAADNAQVRAGSAAAQAGKLANQSAVAADRAVAAAGEARSALQYTADALARAAAAASRARIAAQEASSRAAAAGMDASQARQARIAAVNARNAAAAAEKAAQSFIHADAAWGYAQSAGSAASSAARNADAAAAAASEAASAAGDSDAAAADARAGAVRARAAADRARAASREVDGLVVRITSLVQQAREAASQAAAHARNSAKAADDAAAEADKAIISANKAGVNAQDAQVAANKAVEAVNLAYEISKLAREAADQRLAQEAAYLRDQATQARAIQDAQDAVSTEHKDQRTKLENDLHQLSELVANSDGHAIDLGRVRELAISAVQVGTPAIAGSAAVALASGRDEDLQAFVDEYEESTFTDAHSRVEFLALNDPNPQVQEAADIASYDSGDNIQDFLNTELPEIRKPGLLARTWQLRSQGDDAVKRAADAALRTNTFDVLDGFVNGGGYERALYEDQLRQAYELTRTGTPEVKAAAQAAVAGDREGLAEFIAIEAKRRAAADAQRTTHDEYIDGLLERGYQAAHDASRNAAEAQRSYFAARGDAQTAVRYAEEAAGWAGKAQKSAATAQEHVRKAGESLQFAMQQQERAHAAANQAEKDARAAASNADHAASYAAQAHDSATQAASSAAQARRSADAAGQDAHLAGQAAQEAYNIAWEKQLAEQEQYRAAAAEGELKASKTSLLDAIKQHVGQEALDVLLDLIGVTDVLNCFKGEVSACLWAAVGALPFGKIAKLGKAIPVFKKLISKISDIKSAVRNSRFRAILDDALMPAGCAVSHGAIWWGRVTTESAVWSPTITVDYLRWLTVAKKCPLPPSVVKVPGTNRYPINARYAGGKWRNGDISRMPPGFREKYGDIYFNEKGYPIFDNQVASPDEYEIFKGKVPDIKIKPQGSRYKDVKLADEEMGIDAKFRRKHNLVWHHHEETGRMQLIPRDLHSVVRHSGGWASWGRAHTLT